MEPEDIMYTFDDLKQILEKLRDKENGCPWDSVQTHESMKKYLVEECGEVLEAIDNQDTENLCEELGDVLYQIMIHCEIEKEQGNFTIDDVVNGICEKMVHRHPQAFRRGDGEGPDLGGDQKERKRGPGGRKNGKSPAWPGIPAFFQSLLVFSPHEGYNKHTGPGKAGIV